MTFTELLGNVGIFGAAVMLCLAVLSIISVGMIFDKHRRFRSASRQSEMFKAVLKKFLHGGEIEELMEAVRQHPEVLECYTLMGETDFLLRIVTRDIKTYEAFFLDHLSRLPGMQSVNSSIALSVIKETSALPLGIAPVIKTR